MERTDMKMAIVIIQDEFKHDLSNLLIERGFRATQISSTGGFMHAGNTTMFIGVEERRMDELLNIIDSVCGSKQHMDSAGLRHFLNMSNKTTDLPPEISNSGAIIFVIDVERFMRL